MLASFFIMWPVFQAGFSLLANKIPDNKFDEESWFFRVHRWELNGRIYEKVFKIRFWKRLLPDGAAVFDKGFRKKKLKTLDSEYLKAFIKETCRAEWAHWMQITPFWLFGLWAPPPVIWFMLAYALLVNIPCIIAQRYNRPRLKRLLRDLDKKHSALQ